MRHIIVATTMLVVALVVTFAAASVIQGVAVASGRTNSEPYVVVEAAKPAPMKAVGTKERLTSQYRERGVQTAAQFGL
jgi:hypothetical protein